MFLLKLVLISRLDRLFICGYLCERTRRFCLELLVYVQYHLICSLVVIAHFVVLSVNCIIHEVIGEFV